MNSKQKRIFIRSPKAIQEVMKLLPSNWKLERHGPSNCGWEADISYKTIKFKLIEEFGYITISILKNRKWVTIDPPEDQKLKITYKQIYNLIIRNINEL
jgi:hypothetical protein